jgi:hypothetical protein
LAGLMAVAPIAQAMAQQKAASPDFSSNNVGWVGLNGGGPFFEPVPGRVPGPVSQDPAHPFVPNGVGKQPTYRIADLTNPNLKPWVKETMKKGNDEVLAGKVAFTWNSSCMPSGVPGFMSTGGANPTYFLQTPKQVVIIHSEEFRHVYLDVPHSANAKPSWYGESVGHSTTVRDVGAGGYSDIALRDAKIGSARIALPREACTGREGNAGVHLKGMFVRAAVAAMEAHQCCDYEHPRVGRRLGYRPLQPLDPGEAALKTTGHF